MKITFSVMLGVFMGIVPIWGYQLVTAIALAYLFRLNKLLVIVAANISLPPMIPLILYLSYLTGSLVLGGRAHLMPEYPITLLQEHPDALLTATVETASHPISVHPEWDLGLEPPVALS